MLEQKQKTITYADAGVDIDAGNRAVALMKKSVQSTWRPEVLTGIGGFGGLFALDTTKYREPVLVSGTDGVGTKLRVAFLTGIHNTIGIDAVAMCVNDILTLGAQPLFFLDYLAVGKLKPEQVADIVSGVAEGCRQSGCALIGGETAEMPDFYGAGEYDIAGFAVGVVDKNKIIDGSTIAPGDVLVGLPASGLHSNGYSLARRVLLDKAGYQVDQVHPLLGCSVGEEMLRPTRIYVSAVLPLLNKFEIKGLAHITGGGLVENIPRILPGGTAVQIDTGTWEVPAVFKVIAQEGPVDSGEMYRVFNMGLGMVLVVPAARAGDVVADLKSRGEDARVIGEVIPGDGRVHLT
ncbi:phosphoribosylformylglycinamidine cyclo-ligase [Desulfallas thermosapovorans]|uniref:Phosphoribosylformylglycinamidine cyclo-ligase n=1 Tax=Desulfallas thermosapovorans DSM 6562 TaxID=1121431 RepID=A0A5S4ZTT3_9FIRM|nr:phosphoribosylformylglycinamidine cyclo-ligase [Desulfallas thermosapovorans]TYO96273.1 phosphoribosylformylglycinamidine cyclo-ligase [Desulfallas thermosapovorans DSM 6562]